MKTRLLLILCLPLTLLAKPNLTVVLPIYGYETSTLNGTISLSEKENTPGITIETRIKGLSPGKHGFHIHQVGNCMAQDGSSAKGHYNPQQNPHGGPHHTNRHLGDLGNITANTKGHAYKKVHYKDLSFSGLNAISGRSIIVHAAPDDFNTQPTGNAGKRLACVVIPIIMHKGS
jgi:superoxide dismutase, Cu-Zn family